MSSEQPVDVDGLDIDRLEEKVRKASIEGTWPWPLDKLLLAALIRLKAAEAEVESYQQILADRVGPDIAAINALEAENAALQSRLTALVEALEGLMKAYRYATGLEGAYDEALVNAREAIRAAAEGGAMTTPTAREIVEEVDPVIARWHIAEMDEDDEWKLVKHWSHIKALLLEGERYKAALDDIAGTGTSMPPAAGNEADHYRSVAWGVIGKAARALQPTDEGAPDPEEKSA